MMMHVNADKPICSFLDNAHKRQSFLHMPVLRYVSSCAGEMHFPKVGHVSYCVTLAD